MTARRDGFTLVELLIAMTLVALLAVMLFGGLRFGSRAVAVADARIDHAADVATVYGFLQNAIGNAQLLPTGAQAVGTQARFSGTRERLDFVTMPPAQLALGGFYLLHLGLEPGDGGSRLIVGWQVLSRGMPGGGTTELAPSVLMNRVAGVDFAYLAPPQPGASPEWREEWEFTTELPLLVRLRITLTDGWHVPDLVVAPLTRRSPES